MKHVRLHFVRDVGRQDVVRELRSRFRGAAGKKYPELKSRFDRFVSWLPALHSGDTLAATYRPGDGLDIRLQGERLGSVPGAEFSRALFSLWLSPLLLGD
jgi:hypothetical protein